MAENIIKDFVKKQTTPLNIGVPKQRPANGSEESRTVEPVAPAPAPVAAPATVEVAPEVVRGQVGRPKSDIEKVKLSVYVPSEAKAKLIKIQHHNYKPSLNDILIEAINDLLKKYDE